MPFAHSSLFTRPRWLITGGCGFIGTSLIKHLLANKLAKKIRVLDNLTVGNREDLAVVCDFIEVDLMTQPLSIHSVDVEP